MEENWIRHRFTAIRALLLTFPEIEETFRYRTPFYDNKGMLLYLSLHKKKYPLIGFIDGFHMQDEAGLLADKEGQTMVKHLYIQSENEPTDDMIVTYIADAIDTRKRLTKYGIKNKRSKRA
jgi:hypothetical protein